MAGSILLIAWGLVDHRGIRALLRVSRAEFVVMALTCVATLLLELQTAIYAGVLASLFFYLKRTSQPRVQHWREGDEDILRVGGSIFFGASHYLQVRLQRMHGARVVIEAQQINFIDYSGVEMLHQEARRLLQAGSQPDLARGAAAGGGGIAENWKARRNARSGLKTEHNSLPCRREACPR